MWCRAGGGYISKGCGADVQSLHRPRPIWDSSSSKWNRAATRQEGRRGLSLSNDPLFPAESEGGRSSETAEGEAPPSLTSLLRLGNTTATTTQGKSRTRARNFKHERNEREKEHFCSLSVWPPSWLYMTRPFLTIIWFVILQNIVTFLTSTIALIG